jgi:hypothetical protein
MELAWSFITKWQNPAVSIKTMVNPSQLFDISGDSMRFAQFCSTGYDSWEFAKGAY